MNLLIQVYDLTTPTPLGSHQIPIASRPQTVQISVMQHLVLYIILLILLFGQYLLRSVLSRLSILGCLCGCSVLVWDLGLEAVCGWCRGGIRHILTRYRRYRQRQNRTSAGRGRWRRSEKNELLRKCRRGCPCMERFGGVMLIFLDSTLKILRREEFPQ